MPTLEFQTLLAAPLERVWAFHEDVGTALPALSPPQSELRIESADLPVRAGSRIVLSVRVPLRGRVRWVARIVEHRPPHAVVFGEEARFVDEQESGPFAAWRHEHEMERIDPRQTRLVDRITYHLPLWPLSWPADMLARRQLRAMFAYRHAALHRLLDETT